MIQRTGSVLACFGLAISADAAFLSRTLQPENISVTHQYSWCGSSDTYGIERVISCLRDRYLIALSSVWQLAV